MYILQKIVSIFRVWLYGDFHPGLKFQLSIPKVRRLKQETRQKQIKTKVAAVNKKLEFVILQQINIISLLLFQILAAIGNYQYPRMTIIHMDF